MGSLDKGGLTVYAEQNGHKLHFLQHSLTGGMGGTRLQVFFTSYPHYIGMMQCTVSPSY